MTGAAISLGPDATSPSGILWGVFMPLRAVGLERIGMPRAMSCSPLSGSVLVVVSVAADKQMTAAYARRIVAAMKHAETIGDGPDLEFVADAVRECGTINHSVNQPVSASPAPRSPNPAVAKFGDVRGNRAILVDLLPKAVGKRAVMLMTAQVSVELPAVKRNLLPATTCAKWLTDGRYGLSHHRTSLALFAPAGLPSGSSGLATPAASSRRSASHPASRSASSRSR